MPCKANQTALPSCLCMDNISVDIYASQPENKNVAKKLQWLAQLVEQSAPKHVFQQEDHR